MKEYIEREAALACICSACKVVPYGEKENCPYKFTGCPEYYFIFNLPAADAREAKRGEWIKHNATHIQKGSMYLQCSCCCEYTTVLGHLLAFCPNCGADMGMGGYLPNRDMEIGKRNEMGVAK